MQEGNIVSALFGEKDFCEGLVVKINGEQARLKVLRIFPRDFEAFRRPEPHEQFRNVVTSQCTVVEGGHN